MATERTWNAVPPVLLTANGTTEGVLQVTDTIGFFFGQQATLKNNTPSQLTVYIKRVVNSTTLWVGATKGGPDHNVDLSTFTVATASNISAAEQNKSAVPMEARLQASYMTDPIDAWRTFGVDPYGNPYTEDNPFPTSATVVIPPITISTVGIVGPSPDKNQLEVNSDGSAQITGAGTAGTPDTGVVTIQGITDGTPVDVNLNGLNAFETSQYLVGISAVQVVLPAGTSVISIKVKTTSNSDAVIIGNSNAVNNIIDGGIVGNGYFMFNGESLQVDITPLASVWLIGTSPGQIVCVMEAGD